MRILGNVLTNYGLVYMYYMYRNYGFRGFDLRFLNIIILSIDVVYNICLILLNRKLTKQIEWRLFIQKRQWSAVCNTNTNWGSMKWRREKGNKFEIFVLTLFSVNLISGKIINFNNTCLKINGINKKKRWYFKSQPVYYISTLHWKA